ncbi:MAG: electron transfer flavoprotein subunit beta/FixA family protein [bacterium]
MKLLVCVKAVPLPESSFCINKEGDFYDEGSLKYQVNEYDLYAMEEAIRVRESLGDVHITGVMAGPPERHDMLRKAMALGADQGVLIDDSERPARDAFTTASLISSYAKNQEFDLLLCGVMSEDLMQAQTGPMLAELLSLPCATTVVSLELGDTGPEGARTAICEREQEGGLTEKVELDLPAVITVQSGINTPRYASLTNVLRVKEMNIPVIPAPELYSGGPAERLVRVDYPESTGRCELLEGDAEEVSSEMIERIRARTGLL